MQISIVTSAQTLMRDADAVRFDIENKRWAVVSSYKSLQEETIQNVLINIPIERLNETGQGLRLDVIQNAGVENVAQLLRMTEQQLRAIRGVGEQTARQAKVASLNIERSVRENAQVRIDPDQHTPVAPVYLRRNREDVLKELPELVEMEEWVEFGPDEGLKYYKAVENRSFMDMRRAAWSGGNVATSAKLNRLLEICADAEENNRKIVIFSFFRDVISTVSQTLGQRSLEPITGSVTPARRQQIIDDFTASPAGTTLICQIQAGGFGLNIQAASVVILCEPQIKPALETQAISRAYRMVQTHKVVVHRLLTVNSVDERMMEILGNKQQIFDSYARESVVAESSLQAKDITEKGLIDQIVSQEQERLGLTIRPNSAIQ